MSEGLSKKLIGRRRLIRRMGTVAAGVAGASAAAAAFPSAAQAAPDGNMIIGQSNQAATTTTGLTTSTLANPALGLSNTATTNVGGFIAAGAPLRMQPTGDYTTGDVGSLGVSTDGTLWSVVPGGGGPVSDFVRTGGNSPITRTFSPIRMLDTRNAPGRVNVVNPGVIDADGFVGANQELVLNLDALLVFGWSVFANITVVAGDTGGYVTVFPTGEPRPVASNVNYAPSQVVANFAVVSVGDTATVANAITLYTLFKAKLIVDVSGAIVHYDEHILGGSGSAPGFAAARTTKRRLPPDLIGR